eukprot:559381-Prymnesium_polylepis.1
MREHERDAQTLHDGTSNQAHRGCRRWHASYTVHEALLLLKANNDAQCILQECGDDQPARKRRDDASHGRTARLWVAAADRKSASHSSVYAE